MQERRENNRTDHVPQDLIKKAIPKKTKKPAEKIYGHRIRYWLKKREMIQEELADIAFDGDTAFMSRIMSMQKTNLSLMTAYKLAKALDVPIEDLFIFRPEDANKEFGE